jgi:putative FmdB family regulatory protein
LLDGRSSIAHGQGFCKQLHRSFPSLAGGSNYDLPMPLYEFECEDCSARFEELVASSAQAVACPRCHSSRARRLLSSVSPMARQPRGARVRSDESMRREREAARGERLAASKSKRAKGER